MKKIIKDIIGGVSIIASIPLGLYVGLWLMFIKPILDTCHAFDNGTLTGMIIAITIIKCVFSGTIGGMIVWVFAKIGVALLNHDTKRRHHV